MSYILIVHTSVFLTTQVYLPPVMSQVSNVDKEFPDHRRPVSPFSCPPCYYMLCLRPIAPGTSGISSSYKIEYFGGSRVKKKKRGGK